MLKQYDPRIENAPKVSLRKDGKYYVFNGAHTVLLHSLIYGENSKIHVKVYYGLTRHDETELFCKQNGNDKRVNNRDRIHAQFNDNNEYVYNAISIAQDVGFTANFDGGRSGKDGEITALATLTKIYKSLGDERFRDMLNTLWSAWGGIASSTIDEMMNGLAKFYKNFYGQFDSKELIDKLGATTPETILRNADGVTVHPNGRVVKSKTDKISIIIYNLYNYRKKRNKMPYKVRK